MLNKFRLLTPGPTPLPERVRLALARDMVHHRKKEFAAVMERVQERLRTLFGTQDTVLPLSCSGTGAMTAAVYSLFAPGQKVLVVEGGKFGQRWREIAVSRGLDVRSIDVPWGQAVQPQAVADALRDDPSLAGVLLQHSETSTGVLHPVREVAAVTRKSAALLLVDGISAVGLTPCPMDQWGIDCLLTGSQKGLMLPPGLALLALSPRAWERAEKQAPGCFYFNLPGEKAKLAQKQTLFTSPVNLIAGLDESLAVLLENGLDALYAKQWALTMLARTSLAAMGLKLFAQTDFAWGITSVLLPDGIDGREVLRLAAERHGVCLAGGQDHLKGRMVRVGHMGWVDWSDLLGGLYALNQSLKDVGGYCASRDYLEQGMAAYRAALQGQPGQALPPMLHS
ncbi:MULTISPECIES: pyridoxal-phosphate-dependent aminotransferase family protein [unclassified Desulfovibrio]|uniref:pyridoxal-phosphate-dependent aminotransferase family protein n=1 Tax=unclassified Desulfovibrio TaxID=2593640 RepID=UPI000F5FC237|nr:MULTISPECIES: alanine--glyoxylate aminotransferase family protein [unclassified Desulfovibrio]RRD71272.1 alanine--glyoxylate aminotransferase family protein [Desulfovibrio sp. OH1209_COT-279]RRD87560.1 alanine--glyoxylate aminotransferase family protein [Desulfovibrio sp. OH1186_COT-070]